MKIKIILVNILILLILLGSIEFYYVKKWNITSFKQYWNILTHTISVDEYFTKLLNREPVENAFTVYFREDMNVTSTLRPIVLCGCSFIWGEALKDDETVSYQLADLTGRPVYNRAGRGWGLAQFLYLVSREDFYTTLPEPEYLIYTYIEEHINRLSKFKVTPAAINFQPKYKVSGNKLIQEKPHFYDTLFAVEDFQYEYYYRYWRYNKISDETLKLYFEQAEEEIHKHWPDTKLVIFVYPGGIWEDENPDGRTLWEDIEREDNYTVIFAKNLTDVDLTSEEYRSDGWHPSASAWRIILPKLIEILNIN